MSFTSFMMEVYPEQSQQYGNSPVSGADEEGKDSGVRGLQPSQARSDEIFHLGYIGTKAARVCMKGFNILNQVGSGEEMENRRETDGLMDRINRVQHGASDRERLEHRGREITETHGMLPDSCFTAVQS